MSSSSQEMAPEPTFVQPVPYKVHLEPGKEYYWCTCGESKNQPFCDGSHRDGPFKPKKIVVKEAKTYPLCGCKFTRNEQGFCDGTHRKEEGIRKYNEFLLKANSKIKEENEKAKSQLASVERRQKVIVATFSIALLAIAYAANYTHVFAKHN